MTLRKIADFVEAQGGLCYLCGKEFSADLPPTREHVMPRALGGKTYRNVMASCWPCNHEKKDRAPHPHELAFLEAVNIQLYGKAPKAPQQHLVNGLSATEIRKRKEFAIAMEKARVIRMGGNPEKTTDTQRRKAALSNWRAEMAIKEGRGFLGRPA